MPSTASHASSGPIPMHHVDALRVRRYPPSRIGAMLQVGAEVGIAAGELLRDTGLNGARQRAIARARFQPVTGLHYPAAWLGRAPQLANPIAAAQMSDTCAQLLDELQRSQGMSHRVCEELTRTPGRFPDMEAIAQTLCMTSRNLRRKLEAEGTSYQALLDGARQSLARDYLNRSFLTVDDIAAALGFSDASAFRHAFKRWTGITPAEFRR